MFRRRLSAIARITIGLAGLLVSVLSLAALFGLFPSRAKDTMRSHAAVCETAAIGFSLLADRNDNDAMRQYLKSLVAHNHDIVSMGVRQEDGMLIIDVADHAAHWVRGQRSHSNQTQVCVQLYANGKPWGAIETCFAAPQGQTIIGGLLSPAVVHGGIVTILCLVVFYFYLRAVLRQLNPSRAVPDRVREALNTLAEGLLVLDQNERIVLANRAFGETIGMPIDALTGRSISQLPLVCSTEQPTSIPWKEAIRTGAPVMGQMFNLTRDEREDVTFSVSASPIVDDHGKGRGVLTSFENVTQLERRKRDLAVLVEQLRISSDTLNRQNRELERLATHDTLTGLLIRRPFFERLDAEWKSAGRHGHPLSVVMLDVDLFKSVNDTWGHAAGDEVLRQVAACLSGTARSADVVCRYGGEEFAMLLPHTELADAAVVADRARLAIAAMDLGNFSVTASLGVSSLSDSPKDPQDLLAQADQSLYAAKRAGRNQVVCWGDMPKSLADDKSIAGRIGHCDDLYQTSIPYHAVAALISALAYRDQMTADHSRRVADSCVATAQGLLSFSDCYLLEIAGLLHDIGKIGVPDKVLLKSGPLTPAEWQVMRRNATIGVEIVRASFASPTLNELLRTHPAHFGDSDARSGLPTGDRIPLGARILAIADAYDSMVTDHVYRKGRTAEAAFAELRRCAGTQFDPELVERFISVESHNKMKTETSNAGVSRETALAIGLQIERLLAAIDAQDHDALTALCGRVRLTAEKYGASEIATTASNVCSILETDGDVGSLVAATCELLELCRSTQVAFLKGAVCPGEPADAARNGIQHRGGG